MVANPQRDAAVAEVTRAFGGMRVSARTDLAEGPGDGAHIAQYMRDSWIAKVAVDGLVNAGWTLIPPAGHGPRLS